MGCDIHGFVEIQKDYFVELKRWDALIDIGSLIKRNYTPFGDLFGVRNYNETKPVAGNRGIPKDISDIVKEEIKDIGIDGHSHTWITFEELKQFYGHFSSDWDTLIDMMEYLKRNKEIVKVRLVVWFDN